MRRVRSLYERIYDLESLQLMCKCAGSSFILLCEAWLYIHLLLIWHHGM